MKLTTYRGTDEQFIVHAEQTVGERMTNNVVRPPPRDPGAFVRARFQPGSFGIIVSSQEDEVTVLWSKHPTTTPQYEPSFLEMSYMYSPYVPLQVTHTNLIDIPAHSDKVKA